MKTFQVVPIGVIRRSEDEGVRVEVAEPYRPALKQLQHFSHVIVLWWADRLAEDEANAQLQVEPPYAPGILTGIFATRSEYRPNPVGVSTCPIVEVDETAGIVRVGEIDAYDGTPLIDLKGYFPVMDRVQHAHIPDWLEALGMPEWMPDTGVGIVYD